MLRVFDPLFTFAVLIDVSVLFLALALATKTALKTKAYWLLIYALTALVLDYTTAVLKIDRALGRGGILFQKLAFPRDVNFVIDVSGRVALLIAIWFFVVHFVTKRRNTIARDSR